MSKSYVFVYGTLKSGQCRHGALSKCKFVGNFKTNRDYTLYDLGPFPALCHTPGDGQENDGEIYEISEELSVSVIRNLDGIEGHPHLYKRSEIQIDEFEKQFPGQKLQTYIFPHSRVHTKKVITKW